MIAQNQIGKGHSLTVMWHAEQWYKKYLTIKLVVRDIETKGWVNLMSNNYPTVLCDPYLYRMRQVLPPHTVRGMFCQYIEIN